MEQFILAALLKRIVDLMARQEAGELVDVRVIQLVAKQIDWTAEIVRLQVEGS